jgi:mRNA-degrading endonuclease toxin of MazEF toxin-antitoxin module
MPMPEIRQGEIWLTAFQEGWERPAVIITRNELNRGRLILVVPCTSSRVDERRQLPNHVFLAQGEGGLAGDSVVQCHLIQPVEVTTLLKNIGTLSGAKLAEVMFALAWTTALFDRITE